MAPSNNISRFLDQVRSDWRNSKDQFPHNTTPKSQKPIPFFGNPDTALVATIGVNPSSEEFQESRGWAKVTTVGQWKSRLYSYFNHQVPPHEWFDPWRIGLALLGLSYEDGSAVHLDLSYRATTAMLKNRATDHAEFRRMLQHDADHFFRLLLLCTNLRLLLALGPIPPQKPSQSERLFGYLFAAAASRGFRQYKDEDSWKLWHEPTGRVYVVHDADTPGEKCTTCRVVKNLLKNRDTLRSHLAPQAP
jgi:hypothetical protein